MAASETSARITVLPAPQESQPAPLLNYDSCSSHLLPHYRHDQSCAHAAVICCRIIDMISLVLMQQSSAAASST
ncbi:unnamed protein product [Sphagnum troendelagicum]|uniref:Uncharacterized protein n=1 Tax=Sphagnum troendelagicum TaxID=128251 RepID=A0ABP0TG64_9BRYO